MTNPQNITTDLLKELKERRMNALANPDILRTALGLVLDEFYEESWSVMDSSFEFTHHDEKQRAVEHYINRALGGERDKEEWEDYSPFKPMPKEERMALIEAIRRKIYNEEHPQENELI
jgi:hypothetical protein